jgi:hypothetical protein
MYNTDTYKHDKNRISHIILNTIRGETAQRVIIAEGNLRGEIFARGILGGESSGENFQRGIFRGESSEGNVRRGESS